MPLLPLRVYLYAAAAISLAVLLLAYRSHLIGLGEARGVEHDRVAAEAQREAVAAEAKRWAAKLQDARTSHDAEVAALLVPAAVHHIVCHDAPRPGPVPGPAGVSTGAGPAPGVVQQDAGLHPDIGPALDLLARRADKLAADARELDALTH